MAIGLKSSSFNASASHSKPPNCLNFQFFLNPGRHPAGARRTGCTATVNRKEKRIIKFKSQVPILKMTEKIE
jgi:hypothetical protein